MLARINELTDKSERAECEVARLRESLDAHKLDKDRATEALLDAQKDLAASNQVPCVSSLHGSVVSAGMSSGQH